VELAFTSGASAQEIKNKNEVHMHLEELTKIITVLDRSTSVLTVGPARCFEAVCSRTVNHFGPKFSKENQKKKLKN
jgi:hypothetical protein